MLQPVVNVLQVHAATQPICQCAAIQAAMHASYYSGACMLMWGHLTMKMPADKFPL